MPVIWNLFVLNISCFFPQASMLIVDEAISEVIPRSDLYMSKPLPSKLPYYNTRLGFSKIFNIRDLKSRCANHSKLFSRSPDIVCFWILKGWILDPHFESYLTLMPVVWLPVSLLLLSIKGQLAFNFQTTN